MNRIYLFFNGLFFLLLIGTVGYTLYESGGFGLLPVCSNPDDPWFRANVLECSQPVVVKFGASWCPPCRMLEPELDRLASSGNVSVVRIDVSRNRELARHFHVSSIPDVYLFHNGAMVTHRVGYANYDQLRKWIHGNVSH